jgi:hypothetical protein
VTPKNKVTNKKKKEEEEEEAADSRPRAADRANDTMSHTQKSVRKWSNSNEEEREETAMTDH